MNFPIEPQHLLWWLIVAHCIADWACQGDLIIQKKGKYAVVMLVHCIAWAGVVSIPLALAGMMAPWKVPFLVFGHFVMDQWKCYKWAKWKGTEEQFMKYVYIDQVWHLIQLLIVSVI